MEQYFGMTPTGRTLDDPVGTLVELVDVEDTLHLAMSYAEPPPRSLVTNVELVLSFLEYPMVTGLAELSHHDIQGGTFIYPTGPAFTVKELLRRHAETAQLIGVRAAVELAAFTADILADASEVGALQGCMSHGDLSPWRILLGHDGRVELIGYGVPSLPFDGGPGADDGDAMRYAPPERWTGSPEDARSDLYSLAAITVEVATGRPLHPGHDAAVLRKRIAEGHGPTLIRGAGLPRGLATTLGEALATEPRARPTPAEFAQRMVDASTGAGVEGPTLAEVLQRLAGGAPTPRRDTLRRRRRITVVDPDTASLPFANLASEDPPADEPPSDDAATAPPTTARWERVSRRAKDAQPEPTSAPDTTSSPAPPRRRRRKRLQETTSELKAPTQPPAELEPPRARRRRMRSTEQPPGHIPAPDDVDAPEPPDASQDPAFVDATPPVEEASTADPRDVPELDVPEVDLPAPDEHPPDEATDLAATHDEAADPDTPDEDAPRPETDSPVVSPRRRLTRSGSPSVTSRRRRSMPTGED